MKVEVWSDFACPFCYIGKRRLEAALDQLPQKDEVEVVFRSFELDPQARRDAGHDVYDMLVAKYGMSREQAIAMNENLSRQAKESGLDFHFDTLVLTNTFDAHRLAQYAIRQGVMPQMVEELFRAYFTDSRHLGDRDTLADLAEQAGLDRSEAMRVLAGNDYADNVRQDEAEASRLGVNGVPFFVIDRKYAVSGAQATDVFVNALQKALQEAQPLTVLHGSDDAADAAACSDGACAPSDSRKP